MRESGLLLVQGLIVAAVLLWAYRKLDQHRLRGPGRKRFSAIPSCGWWNLWLQLVDNKNANRRLYNAYKRHGIVRGRGHSFRCAPWSSSPLD